MKDISCQWHELALYCQHGRKLAKLVIPRNLLSAPKVLLFSHKIKHFREGTLRQVTWQKYRAWLSSSENESFLWTCITTVFNTIMSKDCYSKQLSSLWRYTEWNVGENNFYRTMWTYILKWWQWETISVTIALICIFR